MKATHSFPVKFIETNLVLNALMGIKELKFVKTDIIIYDIRDFEGYEEYHFWNSQHYDIGTWSDSYNEDFSRVTRFKHVFIVGDPTIYNSTDFENFIESLSKAKLKANGLYFYNINRKTIDDENLNGLLVENKQPTKLHYYPSLVIENEHLCCGGIFLANDKIEDKFIKEMCITDALFIGDSEKYKEIKHIKIVSAFYSTQEANDKTINVCEGAAKQMK